MFFTAVAFEEVVMSKYTENDFQTVEFPSTRRNLLVGERCDAEASPSNSVNSRGNSRNAKDLSIKTSRFVGFCQ